MNSGASTSLGMTEATLGMTEATSAFASTTVSKTGIVTPSVVEGHITTLAY